MPFDRYKMLVLHILQIFYLPEEAQKAILFKHPPFAFYGNVKRFFASTLKVITVGYNPSAKDKIVESENSQLAEEFVGMLQEGASEKKLRKGA